MATDSRPPFEVVAMCGSQGSMAAVAEILRALPPTFPVPILVADHRPRKAFDHTCELLARRTPLRVVVAEDGERYPGGTVVVAPAGHALRVTAGGIMAVRSAGAPGRVRRDGDVLLTSVAEVFGGAALGVVLSGRLQDGTEGVKAVTRAGGRVLAQDPTEAGSPSMPKAALATGCVSLALPLTHIAPALVSLVMVPGASELFAVTLPPWADLARHSGTAAETR